LHGKNATRRKYRIEIAAYVKGLGEGRRRRARRRLAEDEPKGGESDVSEAEEWVVVDEDEDEDEDDMALSSAAPYTPSVLRCDRFPSSTGYPWCNRSKSSQSEAS
jgi:hypothetical protein